MAKKASFWLPQAPLCMNPPSRWGFGGFVPHHKQNLHLLSLLPLSLVVVLFFSVQRNNN